MECREHRGIHIFSDWFIVEPVDELGQPVAPGVESEKVFITNLANHVQPFIRFELSDRVTLLSGDCRCGSILPRISLKGRTSEVLCFMGKGGREVRVPPFHLTTLAEMVPGVQRFQLVQENASNLLVLFTARPAVDGSSVEARLRSDFQDYLHRNGLDPYVEVTVRRSDVIQRDSSGKVRQVVSKVSSQQ
jgi:phenylacetate-coenzyme A ligase PaaK-like adenylate-forming protein